MLEARLINYDGEEIEGYFWADEDPEEVLRLSYQRAQEEGIADKCSSIHVHAENGSHIDMICL